MGLKIWLNDKLVEQEEAKVSVFDHGLLYGDGVFEGIRVYNGKVFEHEAHLIRLYKSAKVIRLTIPMDLPTLKKAVEETVKANRISDGYIRLVITRGPGDLGMNPFLCKHACVIIIVDKIHLYPHELYEKGLKVISVSTIRNHPMSLPPQVKSMNYLNNIFAKIEAVDAGADEAILYNHQGYVAEASGDNIFIVSDGTLYSPPVQAGSLDGITRQVVIKLARQEGIPFAEKNLTRFDLYTADELFLTGTAAEVIGVVEMDGRIIGDGRPGPITQKLREKFYTYARA
ncbi:MAG TPA: branched-chain-amino-acid transaminase [Anaerohalosphaeraceae bacterium]|jgi:branched-chain amino acid aminotransferase|nr:branched-chain-amino-acid transaminase [Anaerohalosphaeraceae bacterium]HQG04776.1 branched-chain-amino-acid transaminase [Anaerohalosphaeraceae bacterium]HQI06394.1 branched-chain-amino-acid transaminase [Anaerohalosphaeraceae bacterium]HQJ66871.1 branched-chain-amino-acid transaminase [Anaerohalosphaeraceae bacterium]